MLNYSVSSVPDIPEFKVSDNPKRKYVFFTYNNDENIVKVSSLLIKLLNSKADIVIIDDGNNQCSSDLMDYCKTNNIKYYQTIFNRGGNFVGSEAVVGLIKCLYEESKDCDTIIKVDCDTLIMRFDWIERLEKDPFAVFTGAYMSSHDYAAGGAYAIKSHILKSLYEDVLRYGPFRTSIENFEVSCRLFRLGSNLLESHGINPDRSVIRYSCVEDQGFIMGNPYKGDVDSIVAISRWMTFGFDYTKSTSSKDKTKYKVDQFNKMAKVFEHIKNMVLNKLNKSNSK